MKRMIILLLAAMTVAGSATAQRCLPGMRGVELHGGFVDAFHMRNHYAGIAFTRYTRHANRWVMGAEYLSKEYSSGALRVPRFQITGEAGYYLHVLSNPSKVVFLSMGISALAGYEKCNNGVSMLDDDTVVANPETFLYGGALTLQWETFLCDRIALQLQLRERVLWGTDVDRAHTLFGVGLKIMID